MQELKTLLLHLPEWEQKRREERKHLLALLETYKDNIILYGNGNLGGEIETCLNSVGYCAKYFLDTFRFTDIDKNLQQSTPTINLQDCEKYIKKDSLIIVTLYDGYRVFTEIQKELQSRGYKNVINAVDLRVYKELFDCQHHVHTMLGWDIDIIKNAKEKLLTVYDLLGDAQSKEVYTQLLNFAVCDTNTELSLSLETHQYFDSTVYRSIPHESILDCGAFNGDTLSAFIKHNPQFARYTAVEPDPKSFTALKANIERDFSAEQIKKIHTINCAVSDEKGEVSFDERGTTSAHITENSYSTNGIKVLQETIDHFDLEPITMLKMDVEGFELQALRGGKKLILRDKPLLAICGYHKINDLWEVPLFMQSVVPEHTLCLRNYVGYIEFVFYAVPKERLK